MTKGKPPKRSFENESAQSGSSLAIDGDYGGRELIAGVHSVLSALNCRGWQCVRLLISERRAQTSEGAKIVARAKWLTMPIEYPEAAWFASVAPKKNQGVAVEVDLKAPVAFEKFVENIPDDGPALILALDHVEDPHNLGALMRSAAAFGAMGVVIPKDRAAPLTQAARNASAGASEELDLVRVVNLPRALGELKKYGFWVMAADLRESSSLAAFNFPERCVLVLGSEGKGIGREVGRQADLRVSIPMRHASIVTSLNVSNAGAILMHAWYFNVVVLGPQSPRQFSLG